VFIEVFRALASRQRMFGEMQLAEGVGFETAVRIRHPSQWWRRLELEIDALNQRPHRYRNGGPLCHANFSCLP
jgi:hypothetical protein